MRRIAVAALTAILALMMLVPTVANAGNKNSEYDLTWTLFGYDFHGYFQVNPNGLMHQWRADDDALLPGWHFTYQPVGERWPAADCETMVYDEATDSMVPNPKFDKSTLYAYATTGTALDTVFADGTDYWVCWYTP